MAVQLQDENIKVPKEINDIRKALVGIVEDLKAGKTFVEITGGNLQKLSDAIAGIDKVGAEVKEALPETINCLGLLGSGVAKALSQEPA